MDCNAGDTDDIGSAAQLTATMDSSTQVDQSSPQPSVDRLAWALMQDSPQPVISESGTEKRDFDSSFPPSPSRDAKKLCVRSTVHLAPDSNNDITLDDSNIDIEDAVEDNGTTTAHMPCEALQTSPASSLDPAPIQGDPAVEVDAPTIDVASQIDDIIKQLENSNDTIRDRIIFVKYLRQVIGDSGSIPADELADLMATNISILSEETDQIKCNMVKLHHRMISLYKIKVGQANPQTTPVPSAISSISELTPVPSELFTHPPSRRGFEAVTSSPKFENRCTQTEEAAFDTENDSVLSDARYNGLSDIELWERELESIRRLQPLVDGNYTTVNLPLRVSNSQPVSASQRIPGSTQQGLRNNLKSRLKSTLAPTLRFSAIAGGNQGNKDHDVISVYDISDDEVEEIHARASRVGGGDFNMDQVQYAIRGEDEEINFHDPRFRRELQLDGSNDAIDGFPNYEGPDMDEGIQGEVVMCRNRPTVPARHDHDDSEDGNSYHDEKSDGSLFVKNESSESDGFESWDPSSTNVHGCTTVMDEGNAVRRDRSRSPECQLARVGEKRPYREERYYHHEYKRHQSPAQTRREKRVYVKGTSVFARNTNQYGQVKQRYMRDEPESSRFYGYSNTCSPRETDITLRYQDRFNNVGEIPGPKTSLRVDLDRYVKDTGINNDVLGMEGEIESVYEKTFYAGETLDEEQALRSSWANEPTMLYNGFPLVENIGFVAIRNYASPSGDCYWRALAYILYGQPTRWDLIKADHQAYLRHVLGDKTHPRHELHAKLNNQFFESNGPRLGKFKANLWQLLHMPHSWTPGAMQQVTADLYNIHLVTFEYHKDTNLCSDVSVRGAYNSRHVFMLFDGSHFQPLAVNEYLG
ncbi:hypothetical protein FHL15_010243 [Xylaria flabelliformis]|uniref:OTU domain-containing protein n=1 Tax=Xylaria flabelliformis TaxID=2512241 RepID=A0A553HLS1_9PEZI|nr:hypothetical protein FHL15_010243 [Xylaria flabelliformis]